MRKLPVLLLLVALFNLPMFGQDSQVEVFGGYSLERISAGCGTDYRCGFNAIGATTNLNGWTASLTGYFHKSLGLSAQIGGNYGSAGFGGGGGGFSSVHRYSYQFGPVYSFRWQHASPFAHALFGGVSQGLSQGTINGSVPGYTAFIWSVGGGFDMKLSDRLSIRAAQIDYERHQVPVNVRGNPSSSQTSPTNGFRYSTGIVLRY